MADITQGGLLQPTISTKQSQATVPDFYSNYLQDIANLGRNAVQQGGVAGLSPLQQQAINMAPQMAFAGSSSMGTGQNLLTQAGQTGAPELAQAYMNPYQDYMTDELGRLTQRNVTENVLPSLDAAAIGTGNYGSSRAQNMKGQTLRDISTDLFGKQMAQLGTGYQQAITNAQNDLTRAASTGSSLGNLGAQQSALGTGALTTLGNIGKTQQTQAQTELDYPMAQAAKFATLLPAGSVPTGSIENSIQPGAAGQFANSPLANVQALSAYLAAMMDPNATGATIKESVINPNATNLNLAGGSKIKKDGGVVHMADGGYMDDDQGSVDFGPDQYANDHLTDVGGMDHTPSGYEDDYSLPEGYTLDEEGNLVSPDGEIIEIA
jgi:hypothetical protein